MHNDFDVVVVGARCGGASTAMLLAKHGHRVLLVDRARFPSEIAHGHFVHRSGPRHLQRWGLLDKVIVSGCPPATSMLSHFGDFSLVAHDLEVDGVAWGYGPRHGVLDKILVDAAVQAGAEFRDEFSVDGLLIDDRRVTGIRGHTRQQHISVRSTLTIGADGRNSQVARWVAAPSYEAVPPLACWYFTYFADVPDVGMQMRLLHERRVIFTFRTNDDLLAVFIGWPTDEFAAVREDVDGSFFSALDLAPDLSQRVRSGRRAERFYGTADLPNFLRKPWGQGWALVGDAGCHKDPFLALGIADAMRDAELLVDAVHAGFSGAEPLDQALETYEMRRNESTLVDYRENVLRASFSPIGLDVLKLRAALRDKPADTTRFVMAHYGMIPREEFFNPSNLERLLAA